MDGSGFKLFSSFPSPSLSNSYLLETFNWVYSRHSPERFFIWENSHLWPGLTAGTITEHLSLVTKWKSTDLLFWVNVAFLSEWTLFAIAWLRSRLFHFSFFPKGWPEALLKDRLGRSLGSSLDAKDAADCIKDLVLFKGFHVPSLPGFLAPLKSSISSLTQRLMVSLAFSLTSALCFTVEVSQNSTTINCHLIPNSDASLPHLCLRPLSTTICTQAQN